MAHAERSEILLKLQDAGERVEVGGHYVHYRAPDNVYLVTGLSIHEPTESVLVEYQERDTVPPIPWRRPLEGEDGWLTPAVVDDREVSRFTRVD